MLIYGFGETAICETIDILIGCHLIAWNSNYKVRIVVVRKSHSKEWRKGLFGENGATSLSKIGTS